MPRETFFYPETGQLLSLLDEAAQRSAVSRGQAFEDFLHLAVAALSGGAMEDQYLSVVKKHGAGERERRGCDSLAALLGAVVAQMEQTRDDMKDVLGDLFQGAITYNEAGQFLTPMSLCRLMAQLTVVDIAEDDAAPTRRICDPCCGSGRMLLAVAEIHRHWEFVGSDIDLRCVRITALNLAFRNLYGYVIHGNSLANERRLVYRTGFNLRGFIREIPIKECPDLVQEAVNRPPEIPAPTTCSPSSDCGDATQAAKQQLFLF